MITLYLAPLAAVLGLVLYLATTHAKVSEIGRILFFCGLFVSLLAFGSHVR